MLPQWTLFIRANVDISAANHTARKKAISDDHDRNSELLKKEAEKFGMNLEYQLFSDMDPLTQEINARIMDQNDVELNTHTFLPPTFPNK